MGTKHLHNNGIMFIVFALLTGVAGCMTTSVEVDEEAQFPIPLVKKLPLSVGLHMPPELLDYPFFAWESQVSSYHAAGPAVVALRLAGGIAQPLGDAERLLPAKRMFAAVASPAAYSASPRK